MVQHRRHILQLKLILLPSLGTLTPSPNLPSPGGTRAPFSIQRPLLANNLDLVRGADGTVVMTRVRAEIHFLGGALVIGSSWTPGFAPCHVGYKRLLAERAVEEYASLRIHANSWGRLGHATGAGGGGGAPVLLLGYPICVAGLLLMAEEEATATVLTAPDDAAPEDREQKNETADSDADFGAEGDLGVRRRVGAGGGGAGGRDVDCGGGEQRPLERDGVAWSWLLLASSIEGYHEVIDIKLVRLLRQTTVTLRDSDGAHECTVAVGGRRSIERIELNGVLKRLACGTGDARGTGNVCIVWITKQTPTYGISQVVQSELQIRLLCGRVNVSAP